MIYEYECIICGRREDVVKPHYLMDRPEYCEPCQIPMQRRISVPYINYRHNLTVAEKDENTRHRVETGSNRICVGNEQPTMTPKLAEYPDTEYALARHLNG
jgi:hypothetical protein